MTHPSTSFTTLDQKPSSRTRPSIETKTDAEVELELVAIRNSDYYRTRYPHTATPLAGNHTAFRISRTRDSDS